MFCNNLTNFMYLYAVKSWECCASLKLKVNYIIDLNLKGGAKGPLEAKGLPSFLTPLWNAMKLFDREQLATCLECALSYCEANRHDYTSFYTQKLLFCCFDIIFRFRSGSHSMVINEQKFKCPTTICSKSDAEHVIVNLWLKLIICMWRMFWFQCVWWGKKPPA